ncbi:hypothetical protein C8Q80DRAFT_1220408 [Daedaleopsis nitida]|nr:hypothetical protein C8Q80DRAFT_1220408 [Daedaleopsis nitida]
MIRKSPLEGFKIPGVVDAVKATLFADDTTTYLAEHDDFSVLQEILDTWCSAAKAKFNIAKTEVLPIGTRDFRTEMAETYKSTGRWRNFPEGARVAGEGEPVRILGAFVGNGVEQCGVWTPTIAKIDATVQRWQAGISTIEGRRHVTQMVFGGMTQFLTDVQSMPAKVCKRVETMMSKYLWHDRVIPPVSKEHVQQGFGAGDHTSISPGTDQHGRS